MLDSVNLRLDEQMLRHLNGTVEATGISANKVACLVYRAGVLALSPSPDATANLDAIHTLRDYLHAAEVAKKSQMGDTLHDLGSTKRNRRVKR